VSIVGNNLLLFQNSQNTNSQITKKSISNYPHNYSNITKCSFHTIHPNSQYVHFHTLSKISQSQTQFIQNMISIPNPNSKLHNPKITQYSKTHVHKTIAKSQLSIQKFTTQNSMLLIDSQIPTVTKNISPGRIVLSAPLPTLSGAW